MEWDSLVWHVETSEEENEIRLVIEGTCRSIDEDVFRQLQARGIEVNSVRIGPEGTTEGSSTGEHGMARERSRRGRWHPAPR